jgi:hypothetical protein
MMPFIVSRKKFTANQKSFKEEFAKDFISKLESYEDISMGKATATVKYTKFSGLIANAMKTVISDAASSIPLIGPFAARILTTVPGKIYEHQAKKGITKHANEVSAEMIQLGASKIEALIEEVGHEITRIFEYQISVLRSEKDAKKLAEFAVEKILASGAGISGGHNRVEFDRDGLLGSLLRKEDESTLSKIADRIVQGNAGEKEIETILTRIETLKSLSVKSIKSLIKQGIKVEI